MNYIEIINLMSQLWDYVYEKKNGDGEATNKLMEHLGLDNHRILQTRNLEEWKSIVDKFLIAQKIMRDKLNI